MNSVFTHTHIICSFLVIAIPTNKLSGRLRGHKRFIDPVSLPPAHALGFLSRKRFQHSPVARARYKPKEGNNGDRDKDECRLYTDGSEVREGVGGSWGKQEPTVWLSRKTGDRKVITKIAGPEHQLPTPHPFSTDFT